MPFWPWYMLACAVLILIGRDGKWLSPAAVLAGLIAMRAVMTYTDGPWQMLLACEVWLSVGAFLAYKEKWVASILCATSGLVYLVLMFVGLTIEYMGPVPILADLMIIAGLASSYVGGGGGLADNSDAGAGRNSVVVVARQEGMAARQDLGTESHR